MASTHDYTFYGQSRIGDDRCGISQRNIKMPKLPHTY